LILVDAGWGVAEAGVSSAATAGEGEGGCAEECCPEKEGLAVPACSGLPEEEQGCGQEAEEGCVVSVSCALGCAGDLGGFVQVDSGDGVDGGGGGLGGTAEGDARGEQRAGGVEAGSDGGAVEDDGSAEGVLRRDGEGVGGGDAGGDGGTGSGASIDREGEGAVGNSGACELEGGGGVGVGAVHREGSVAWA